MTTAAAPLGRLRTAVAALVALLLLSQGCIHQPMMVPASKQKPVDHKLVECPTGFQLVLLVNELNSPTAIAFDADGNLLVAESAGVEPHIFGYHADGKYFNIYPWNRNVSFYPAADTVLYGSVGGMVTHDGKIYVSHHTRDGKGAITALGYDGTQTTIVAGLPAQGDYGVTDLVFNRIDGRLYFGVGTATNSGVVGPDNWAEGWLKRYPDVHDEISSPHSPPQPYKLRGYRFDSKNPWAGLFGGGDVARTRPFQPFGERGQELVDPSDKPNGAIYSCAPDGGDCHPEATGIHNPRGLAFSGSQSLYFTNDGMQLRGTRPVMNDPDCLLKWGRGVHYGWPDFSTDGRPISDPTFQPPIALLGPSGYTQLSPLIDPEGSGLPLNTGATVSGQVAGVFQPLSGAAKLDFAPESGPFAEFFHSAIVALDGDQAPFTTSGVKLKGPIGHMVVRVDLDSKTVKDFIRNTAEVPASMQAYGTVALERPIDVKFGPDGAIYILDFGRMENKTGIPRLFPNTGRIFKLIPVPTPATTPATATPTATTQASN